MDQDITDWTFKRNTQANFDTILQVISLRSQPESLSIPKKMLIKFDDFEKQDWDTSYLIAVSEILT
jgi:hypothetical protein